MPKSGGGGHNTTGRHTKAIDRVENNDIQRQQNQFTNLAEKFDLVVHLLDSKK